MFSFDAATWWSPGLTCFLSTLLPEHKGFQLLAASPGATSVGTKNPWARPPETTSLPLYKLMCLCSSTRSLRKAWSDLFSYSYFLFPIGF